MKRGDKVLAWCQDHIQRTVVLTSEDTGRTTVHGKTVSGIVVYDGREHNFYATGKNAHVVLAGAVVEEDWNIIQGKED